MDIRPRQCPNCEGAVIFLMRKTCGDCGSELVEIEPVAEYEIEDD